MTKKFSAILILIALAACSGGGGSSTSPLPVTPTTAPQMLWVANDSANSVAEFSLTAAGAQAPVAVLSGAATGLDEPMGVAFDASGKLWVVNQGFVGPPAIRVFAAGATGNAAPVQVISGAATTLVQPSGIAIDPSGNIWVADLSARTVDVFAPTANGNVAPIRTVTYPNFYQPVSVAADASGNIYLADSKPTDGGFMGLVYVFPDTASGPLVSPRAIAGLATTLNQATGVTVDGAGEIIVSDLPSNAVDVFASTASGNVAPIRRIVGAATSLSRPTSAIAAESNGTIHVANQGSTPPLFTFAPGANGNVAPSSTLTSSSFSFPYYMTIH
jgi:NHL repeat-containing protein